MLKKGDSRIIIIIVLALVCMVIGFGIVFQVRDGPLHESGGLIDKLVYTGAYKEACTQLSTTSDNFETGDNDTFTLTLDYDVDVITHYALYFKDGWSPFDGWYLDAWKLTCTGSDGDDYEILRYTVDTWILGDTYFSKISSSVDGAGLGCGNTVTLHTWTGDDTWSGTGGDVYLCYLVDRRD